MSEEILTSTGSLGLERRTYDRLYLNWPYGFITNVDVLARQLARAERAISLNKATRCVGRFIVAEDVFYEASSSPRLSQVLEAAAPVTDWHGQNIGYMTMFGINHESRLPLEPIAEMLTHVPRSAREHAGPTERYRKLSKEGYQYTGTIEGWMIPQIYQLWSSTFGWSLDEVYGLKDRLDTMSNLPTYMRSVWFSSIYSDHQLHAIAMAERLDMPLGDGRMVPVIESTEWRVHELAVHRGFMTSAVSLLHEQVIGDLKDLSLPPLIVAETNYASSAYNVAWAVGMEAHSSGDSSFPPQILSQNVFIGDGLRSEELRDFVFMYLPLSTVFADHPHIFGDS